MTLEITIDKKVARTIEAAAGSLHVFFDWSTPGTKTVAAAEAVAILNELKEIEAGLTCSWTDKRPIRKVIAKVEAFVDSIPTEEAPTPTEEEADGVIVEKNEQGLEIKFTARELWLQAATTIFREWFAAAGYELPENIRVSCGLAGANIRSKTIGECWSDHCSKDAAREIFISPVLEDPSRVLDVLIHELCHSLFPVSEGHGKNFGKAARAMGLEGKLTATTASPELFEMLKPIIEQLGAYPHAALTSMKDRKKQTTRLIKLVCPDEACGYTCRTTAKWLEVGFPTCPCGEVMTAPGYDPTGGEDDDEDGGDDK